MRLWHIDIIPYLPKSQLLAQWRELNSIFKKQDNHILINYVYNYDKAYLYDYSKKVINEIQARNYKIKSFENFEKYFGVSHLHEYDKESNGLRFKEHCLEYLLICYYNLEEKYLRGQKDFTDDIWEKLRIFVCSKMIVNKTEKILGVKLW